MQILFEHYHLKYYFPRAKMAFEQQYHMQYVFGFDIHRSCLINANVRHNILWHTIQTKTGKF